MGFSPDGRWVVTGSVDDTARVLAGEVFSEEWRDLVGRRAGMSDACYDSASL